jgi:hypothetical protein
LPFVEFDAMARGPGWLEAPDDELRSRVAPPVASGGWVIDGTHQNRRGDLVLSAADLIVWLDLPVRVWMPRLARRTWRRPRWHEPLWNDNREVSSAILGWDSLFVYALRSHFRRRREWPRSPARYRVIRLRICQAVDRFLDQVKDPGDA